MKKQKKRKYDNILSDLDKVISKLNSVNTPIEESIKLFEEGVKLSDEAEKEILEVEKSIEKIKKIKISEVGKIDIEKSLNEVDVIIENKQLFLFNRRRPRASHRQPTLYKDFYIK